MNGPVPTPRSDLLRRLEREFPGGRIEPMIGDASTRVFLRLHLPGGASRVVMDYGRSFDDETEDVRLARVFRAASLPVAAIERCLPDAGCLVLEDLGDWTLQRVVAQAAGAPIASLPPDPAQRDERLYERAVDLASELATRGSPVLAASDRPPGLALDADRFRFEMGFFVEHFLRGRLGAEPPDPLLAMLDELAVRAAVSGDRVLCHRDFHSRNLMVRGDGSLAMVDIQDARWGPDAYDLASLLRDAYVEVPEDRVERMIERFLAARPDLREPERFRRRFDVVAAQRMLKALGTFGFQLHERGNRRYADAERRMRSLLDRVLAAGDDTAELHHALAGIGAFRAPEHQ